MASLIKLWYNRVVVLTPSDRRPNNVTKLSCIYSGSSCPLSMFRACWSPCMAINVIDFIFALFTVVLVANNPKNQPVPYTVANFARGLIDDDAKRRGWAIGQ